MCETHIIHENIKELENICENHKSRVLSKVAVNLYHNCLECQVNHINGKMYMSCGYNVITVVNIFFHVF